MNIALVGNPNSGKTTLFNALTGAKQRVGNWPGVTVDKLAGTLRFAKTPIEVVDLPGTYSLNLVKSQTAIDTQIACQYIAKEQGDLIVNVVDADNLERNLYLTMQLIDMQVPMCVVLTKIDLAQKHQKKIDIKQLAKQLGCPVFAINAKSTADCKALSRQLERVSQQAEVAQFTIDYPDQVKQAQHELSHLLQQQFAIDPMRRHVLALRCLEQDDFASFCVPQIETLDLTDYAEEDFDILIADSRYQAIKGILSKVLTLPGKQVSRITAFLDSIVLHRVLGLPIFLLVMYSMFVFSINVAGAFQDFFDIASRTLLVDGVHAGLMALHAPAWVSSVLAGGVGVGINTTVTFIPVIGGMFLCLAFLEDCGYMARAAFVIDRVMRMIGLPGKAFVPLIVGFGCNVPAIMGARTLEHQRERILTIMMAPFMSCGARLAIFAVFVSAFFSHQAHNVVFALYLIGIAVAVLTAILLRMMVFKGPIEPLLLEIPSYHWPSMRTVVLHAGRRLYLFLRRASRVIIPLCMVLGMLNSLSIHGTFITQDADVNSLLSALGRFLSPLFSPMGITADNWPATVGLATGILAKEVVIATLNTLYVQVGHLAALSTAADFSFWAGLQEAVLSIVNNLSELGQSMINPIVANAASTEVSQGVYGLMNERFGSEAAAFSYLLFVLLYVPCVSTVAVIIRELNYAWACFSVLWSTGIAYAVAVGYFQLSTWSLHPLQSGLYLVGIISLAMLVMVAFKYKVNYLDVNEHKEGPL